MDKTNDPASLSDHGIRGIVKPEFLAWLGQESRPGVNRYLLSDLSRLNLPPDWLSKRFWPPGGTEAVFENRNQGRLAGLGRPRDPSRMGSHCWSEMK